MTRNAPDFPAGEVSVIATGNPTGLSRQPQRQHSPIPRLAKGTQALPREDHLNSVTAFLPRSSIASRHHQRESTGRMRISELSDDYGRSERTAQPQLRAGLIGARLQRLFNSSPEAEAGTCGLSELWTKMTSQAKATTFYRVQRRGVNAWFFLRFRRGLRNILVPRPDMSPSWKASLKQWFALSCRIAAVFA